jgi:hypothetical protein
MFAFQLKSSINFVVLNSIEQYEWLLWKNRRSAGLSFPYLYFDLHRLYLLDSQRAIQRANFSLPQSIIIIGRYSWSKHRSIAIFDRTNLLLRSMISSDLFEIDGEGKSDTCDLYSMALAIQHDNIDIIVDLMNCTSAVTYPIKRKGDIWHELFSHEGTCSLDTLMPISSLSVRVGTQWSNNAMHDISCSARSWKITLNFDIMFEQYIIEMLMLQQSSIQWTDSLTIVVSWFARLMLP